MWMEQPESRTESWLEELLVILCWNLAEFLETMILYSILQYMIDEEWRDNKPSKSIFWKVLETA